MQSNSKTAKNADAPPILAPECLCDPNAKPGDQQGDCCPDPSGSAPATEPAIDQPKTRPSKDGSTETTAPKKRRPRIRRRVPAKVSGKGRGSNNTLLIGGGIALAILLLKPGQPKINARPPQVPQPPPPPVQPPKQATVEVLVE